MISRDGKQYSWFTPKKNYIQWNKQQWHFVNGIVAITDLKCCILSGPPCIMNCKLQQMLCSNESHAPSKLLVKLDLFFTVQFTMNLVLVIAWSCGSPTCFQCATSPTTTSTLIGSTSLSSFHCEDTRVQGSANARRMPEMIAHLTWMIYLLGQSRARAHHALQLRIMKLV